MKKTMLAAALAALAIGSASADTIYITGSTAFRKAANDAIQYYVTNTKSGSLVASDSGDNGAGNAVWNYDTTNYIVAYWSGSEAGIQSVAGPTAIGYKTAYNTFTTNISTFTNTVKPTNLVVGGAWTGVAGNWTNKVIVTNSITNTIASQPNYLKFWDPTQSFTVDGTKRTNGVATINKVSAVANIAFSDTLQASSAFGSGKTVAYFATNNLDDTQTTNAAYYGIKTPTNRVVVCASNSYVNITNDIPVGVVGFGFIVSGNAAPSQSAFSNSVIANITKAQAADLYKKGKVNLAEYTGALSDTNRFVYAMGRSIDSGTRLVTFSMLGLGSTVTNNSLDNGVNTGINQYLILGTNSGLNAANSASSASVFVKADGTSITNTNSMIITNFPADVTVGKLCATGHNGYASGGNLCKSIGAITAANSPGNAVAIGYAGIPDASGNATVIAYEGVYPSTESIKSGSYPFWSVEHILVQNDAPQSIQDAASGIATKIKLYSTTDLQSRAKCTVALADVTNNVTRTVDGGTITKSWTNGVTLTNLPSYYTTSKQSSAGAGIGF